MSFVRIAKYGQYIFIERIVANDLTHQHVGFFGQVYFCRPAAKERNFVGDLSGVYGRLGSIGNGTGLYGIHPPGSGTRRRNGQYARTGSDIEHNIAFFHHLANTLDKPIGTDPVVQHRSVNGRRTKTPDVFIGHKAAFATRLERTDALQLADHVHLGDPLIDSFYRQQFKPFFKRKRVGKNRQYTKHIHGKGFTLVADFYDCFFGALQFNDHPAGALNNHFRSGNDHENHILKYTIRVGKQIKNPPNLINLEHFGQVGGKIPAIYDLCKTDPLIHPTMIIEQIYTGCLAQGAYYLQSGTEAAIIDPLREVSAYISKASARGATIKYVFETHFHADFVSGHLDLARQTGAQIVYGPTAQPTFPAYIAKDNEEFQLGDVVIRTLHTPGHTLESVSYLLIDENGKETALFSGDTLFIGDVGRPDLAQKAAQMTQEELAGTLFDSLRKKIMPLNDDVIVYPAHGAGSACGKNMSKETSDTLGNQKKSNYALRASMTRTEFIHEVTEGLTPPPAYFPLNVKMNREGYESFDKVLEQGTHPLDPEAFEHAANTTGALLLDTRNPQTFAAGFIPNSINIGIDGSFAPWVGALIPDIRQEILIIADPDREDEVVTRLARVGYDRAIGFLNGGIAAWQAAGKELDHISSLAPEQLAGQLDGTTTLLDVRKPSEFESGHVEGAWNVPLESLNDRMNELDKHHSYYVHCAGGYRSMIFASILKARGFDELHDVTGGFKALQESGKFMMATGVR